MTKKAILKLCMILGMVCVFSCKKDKPYIYPKINVGYEVIIGNNKDWYGSYIDETGTGISIFEYLPAPSKWKITLEPITFPFNMNIMVTPKMAPNDFNYPQITINIYVNNAITKTITINNSPSASLQYAVQ